MKVPEEAAKVEAQIWVPTDSRTYLEPLMADLPGDWLHAAAGVKAFWVSAYEIRGLRPGEFARPRRLDVMGLRLILRSGDMSFVDTSAMTPDVSEDGDVGFLGKPKERTMTDGTVLLVVASLTERPRDLVDAQSYERTVEVALALLRGIVGRNIAWRRLFQNVYDAGSGDTFIPIGVHANSRWYGPPDISNQTWQRLETVASAVVALPEHVRNRVELSLRWFNQSFDTGDVDDFLRVWIALETLAMTRKHRVERVLKILGAAYGIDADEAERRFSLWAVQKIRHKIVHDGQQQSVAVAVVVYLQAVYLDILEHQLDLAPLRRAERALRGPAQGVLAYVSAGRSSEDGGRAT